MDILISRYAYTKEGTFGVLNVVDQDRTIYQCLTVERPWLNNEARVSCIPEGAYKLNFRESGIVNRTSRGEFTSGYEIAGVRDRSYIMIHIANSMEDLQGCVGVGSSPSYIHNKWAVGNSRNTFRDFMIIMDSGEEHHTVAIDFDKAAMLKYR